MRLEIRQLELLVAVERAGSISGAARLLGVEQPHVSRQLRRIEELLGHAVFDRTAGGTVLTAEGAAVLQQARAALRSVDELATTPPRTGPFHILTRGMTFYGVLDVLRSRFPGVDVTIAHSEPGPGRAALLDGTADLFLAVRIPHEEWPDPAELVETEILVDPTVVLMSADHPLAGKDELELAELADADWITGTAPVIERMAREECRLLGGFEPRVPHRTSDTNVMDTLLAGGLGVMFGAASMPHRRGFVGRRYRGATPAHWVMLHRPGVLPAEVLAEVVVAARADHAATTTRAQEAERAGGGGGVSAPAAPG